MTVPTAPAPAPASVYTHTVRYHETDAQGFLFNARYMELADVALSEFFRHLGWPYTQLVAEGTDPSLVSAAITFAKPARFDDVVDVLASCTRVGRSSFDLSMTIVRGDDLLATLDIVYVNVDAASATSRPLPEPVAHALRAAISV